MQYLLAENSAFVFFAKVTIDIKERINVEIIKIGNLTTQCIIKSEDDNFHKKNL